MKKQKAAVVLIFSLALFSLTVLASSARADYGGATVWWTAPTTDQGGGALGGGTSDLAGYNIYYSTSAIDCTAWNAADQTARKANAGALLPISPVPVTVAEAATMRKTSPTTARGFTFSNTALLAPGSAYNFAVVARDSSGNLSNCATDGATVGVGNTFVSKTVTFAADLNNDNTVNGGDFSLFRQDYGNATPAHQSDFNGDGNVNGGDFSLFRQDYNKSYSSW